MEDMSEALKLVSALPRSPWPGRHRNVATNCATSRARQITSLGGMMALIRKLSLKSAATMAKAEIAEVDTANLCSEYAVKKTRAGLGARERRGG